MYTIAIVDDEKSILKDYEQLFARYSDETKNQFNLTFFSDGLDLVQNYKSGYDVVFLDIDMQKLNGLQTAKKLREMDESAIVIFVTRLAKYAINGYEYNAFDFILKPLDYFTLQIKMQRILKLLDRRKSKNLTVRYNGTTKVLDCVDIVYIESMGHNLIYHTKDGAFECPGVLAEAEKELKDYNFILCHRSCLVNVAYITDMKNDSIIINGIELPISRLRKKEFTAYLTNYIGKNI